MNKKENFQQTFSSIRIKEINKKDKKKVTPNKQNKIIKKYYSNKTINDNNLFFQSNKNILYTQKPFENNTNCITKRNSQSTTNRIFRNGKQQKYIQSSHNTLILTKKNNYHNSKSKNLNLYSINEQSNNAIRKSYNYSHSKTQNSMNLNNSKSNVNLQTIISQKINSENNLNLLQSPLRNISINNSYKKLVAATSEKEKKRDSIIKHSYHSKSHSFNNIRNTSSSQRKNRNQKFKHPNNYSLSISNIKKFENNNNISNNTLSHSNIKELSKIKNKNLNSMLIGNSFSNTKNKYGNLIKKSYINISTLSTINTSKLSNNKKLLLNNSTDNFNLKSVNNINKSKLLSSQNQKPKLTIKVNRKPQKVIKTILHTKVYNKEKKNNSSKRKIFSNQISKKNLLSNHNNNNFMEPKYILYKYHKILTKEEIQELQNYSKKIYFLGLIPKRLLNKEYTYINLNKSTSEEENKRLITNNLDESTYLFRDRSMKNKINEYSLKESKQDSEGNYKIIKGDHLDYRYEILNILGQGSYGEAIKCYDHKKKENVCIKIIKANEKFKNQAMIEIKILEHIRDNDIKNEYNIVKYYSYFTFRNHICLVFELLDINLYEHIKNNNFQGFDIKKIKQFTTEILFSLFFLKNQKIIHCDLKPENILLYNNNNNIKVIDFGSSCYEKEKMYSYIQSRFYRAPEVILEQGYSYEIDMWSLGCIICELFTGFPIFPGEDERDQLNYIMEYLDIPPTDYINISRKRNLFFDKNHFPFQIPNSKGKIRKPKSKKFKEFLQCNNESFIDFIKKCLKWEPKNRLSPEEALLHSFIINGMSSDKLINHKNKIKQVKLLSREKSKNKSKGNKSTLNSINSISNLCLNILLNNSKEKYNKMKRNSESCCSSYRKNFKNNFKMWKEIYNNFYQISNPSSLNLINKNTISNSISLQKNKIKKGNNMKQLYTRKKIVSYLELSVT